MHTIWSWYPPVGVYIGVLAFLGVLVPLFRDLTKIGRREKAIWTFIMFALVLLEIKSIYQDRNNHDEQERKARELSEENFKKIAGGIEGAITESQRQFKETMNGIQAGIKTTTGGNSIAYVKLNMDRPDDPYAYIVVFNRGDYPLQGMTVTIMDDYRRNAALSGERQTEPLSAEKLLQLINSADTVVTLPYLRAHDQQPMGKYTLPQTDNDRISIEFSALNGIWMETLHLRHFNGHWLQALSVGGVNMQPFKPAYIYFDKGYPEGKETIKRDWFTGSGKPSTKSSGK